MPLRDLLRSLWGFLRTSKGPAEAGLNSLAVLVLTVCLFLSWAWFRWRPEE